MRDTDQKYFDQVFELTLHNFKFDAYIHTCQLINLNSLLHITNEDNH